MSYPRVQFTAVAALVVCLCATAGWGQTRLPREAPIRDKPALIHTASIRRLPVDEEVIEPAPHPVREVGMSLYDFEQIAMVNNPALAAANAQVHAAEGNWVQVGLKPNPTVGYVADDIGANGSGGAHGLFVRQEFVRGNKLQLNREVAGFATARREAQRTGASMRIMTDVRTQFYRVLLAQRRIELANQLAANAENAAETAEKLWEVEEGLRVDYLRARVDADRLKVDAEVATSQSLAAWRALAAVIGLPGMQPQPVTGDLDDALPQFNYEIAAEQLVRHSPLVIAAQAEVQRTAWAIDRAQAEPIPNLQTGFEVKHDTSSDNMLVVVEAGFQLPLWDRNQGGIQQACGQHAAAVAQLAQLQLQLRQRLAAEFQNYEAARMRALRYAQDIVPNSRKSMELVEAGLAAGELKYLDLLTARRALFEANAEYIDALEALWVSSQRIDGMLLSGSLQVQD